MLCCDHAFTPQFASDVVPVHPDTVSDWTHPPYSGEYDGKTRLGLMKWGYSLLFSSGTRIWGRGSSDDKVSDTRKMDIALSDMLSSLV